MHFAPALKNFDTAVDQYNLFYKGWTSVIKRDYLQAGLDLAQLTEGMESGKIELGCRVP